MIVFAPNTENHFGNPDPPVAAMPQKRRGIQLSARECYLLLALGAPILLNQGSMSNPIESMYGIQFG